MWVRTPGSTAAHRWSWAEACNKITLLFQDTVQLSRIHFVLCVVSCVVCGILCCVVSCVVCGILCWVWYLVLCVVSCVVCGVCSCVV